MWIERIEVEEGFLDSFVADFSPGLNVLIGPRGTGKTSVIELIRFCLESPAFTEDAGRDARRHALDVLGTGRVTVTLNIEGERVRVSRAAGDQAPRVSSTAAIDAVTVLSQKEVEKIGLDADGRLRLIDEFAPVPLARVRSEDKILQRLRSLSAELAQIAAESESLADALQELAAVQLELATARAEEEEFQAELAGHKTEQAELEALLGDLDQYSLRRALITQTHGDVADWRSRLATVVASCPMVPDWPVEAGTDDPLGATREALATIRRQLDGGLVEVTQALETLSTVEVEDRKKQADAEDRARELRRSLDAAATGAGAATAKVAQLRERLAARQATEGRHAELGKRLEELQGERHQLLDDLDEVREAKYQRREATCSDLNKTLGPRINVRVIRYGHQSAYSAAIASALRGSRLKYNLIAPTLAAALSPRELVDAAESNDVASIREITGLDEERLARALTAIREAGVGDVLAAPLEDSVEMRLLDGTDYKLTENLSTGQRCTVVLPLLLEQRGRVLVIDQPEDHLDNGFVTETVVKAVCSRPPEDQLIVASHNANIPVLGDARRVIVLESDGRTGRVASSDVLDAEGSVEAITRIMEGGREAFKLRGAFYAQHGD
ncbi:MAG: AAA family ATPase [Acidimicrobiales bacterium]